jgi:LPS sulfotransferase NodH
MIEPNRKACRQVFWEALQCHGVDRCVIVTGSFRAGTSFICTLLEKNGLPSVGKEKFRKYFPFRKPGTEKAFREQLGETFATAQDGLFCSKLMWPHRNYLSLALDYGRDEAAAFAQSFPDAKWINVIRRDKFAQAISFWKAKLTDRWHVHGDEAEPEVIYDFEGIRKAFVELSGHDMLWQDFHARAGTGARSITYEDFLTDVAGKLHELLGFIGDHRLPVERLDASSPLRRQSNEQSAEFRERFIADFYCTGF